MSGVSGDGMRRVAAAGAGAGAAAAAAGPMVPPRHNPGKAEVIDAADVVLADRVVTQDPVKIRNPFSSHSLQKEYDALTRMQGIANGAGVSIDDGKKFFDLQYGKTDVERLAHFKAEFGGRWPTDVEKDSKIVKDFVTPKFIELFKKFAATPKMTRLRLNGDDSLYRIPANIGQCTSLQKVNFARCALQSIPDTLLTLPMLAEINLSRNPFGGDFKRDFCAMPRLKILNLSYCQLDSFDSKFKSDVLEVINLQFNGLRALPYYKNNGILFSCLDRSDRVLAWWDGNKTLLPLLSKDA